MKSNVSVLDQVDARTNLAGRNRLELLLFRLETEQLYAINVFKVREVLSMDGVKLTHVPGKHHTIVGLTHLRGIAIEVMDLSLALGLTPISDPSNCFLIITEFNRQVQGFLVNNVDRIINMSWDRIMPPPQGLGSRNYLTAVTDVDNQLAEVIDVEKVLAEIMGMDISSDDLMESSLGSDEMVDIPPVLVVDDSSMAHKQITKTLDDLGVAYIRCWNGREAHDKLQELKANNKPIKDQLLLVVADIEMPEMDGYTLTTKIKSDPELQDLFVVLHTSLSGMFNKTMVQKVGANAFLTKFSPDELRTTIEREVANFRERTGR